MAARARRLPTNADGAYYVDSTCIDCATCRWMAPDSFDAAGDKSRVHRQPATAAERHRADMALLACPVAAIGTTEKRDLGPARAAFPDPVADNVFHCGYHSAHSFGAAGYLIVRDRAAGGNVLIDSPRFTGALVRRLEDLGGVATLFLTHKDDVADHARFAAHFGCTRILHADDVTRDTRDVEHVVHGRDPVALDDETLLIPVPGHTRGSVCLLYRDTFLFTGDHLAWSAELGQVYGFRGACWYDWRELVASTERLLDRDFEWILPGHGRRCHFPRSRMKDEMRRCVAWMREA